MLLLESSCVVAVDRVGGGELDDSIMTEQQKDCSRLYSTGVGSDER